MEGLPVACRILNFMTTRALPALFLALLAPVTTRAQQSDSISLADSAITLIRSAIVGGPSDAFDKPLALLDRILASTPTDGVALHYKGYALYRKASALSGDDARRKEFKSVLQEADRMLAQSAALLAWPETIALRATVMGQLIGVSGIFAIPRLGQRTNRLMDDAVALGPDNPRVWLLKGISAIHKPKGFGGGLDNAERDLKKAIELFPADSAAAPKPSWGHAESWAWLGRVYADQKRVEDARAAYARALELQPQFEWVSHHLLPALAAGGR